MITWHKGNILDTEADTILCPVNCTGYMKHTMSLKIGRAYRNFIEPYKILCKEKKLAKGVLWLYPGIQVGDKKNILCFPVKNYQMHPIGVDWIESGLKKFVSIYKQLPIQSLAVPQMGKNDGEPNWVADVKPLLIHYLGKLDINVEVWETDETEYTPYAKKDAVDILKSAPVYSGLSAVPTYASVAEKVRPTESEIIKQIEAQQPQNIKQLTRTVYFTGDGVYIPVINKVIDMYDFNNSAMLSYAEASFAAQFQGKVLPSKKDCLIIMYYLDEINEVLKKNGGTPVQYNMWTCTEGGDSQTVCVCNIQDMTFHFTFKVNRGPARLLQAL